MCKCCRELNPRAMLPGLVSSGLPQGGEQLSFQSFVSCLLRLCPATVNICRGRVCSSFSQHAIAPEMLRGPWGVCHGDVLSGAAQKGENAAAFCCLHISKSKGGPRRQTGPQVTAAVGGGSARRAPGGPMWF